MQTVFARSGNQISYNFASGKRKNGFGYNIPVFVTGTTGFNNQLFRPIQFFIFYQFQNRVYPFQQQPRLPFGNPNKFYQPADRNQPYGNQQFRPQQPPTIIKTISNMPANRNTAGLPPQQFCNHCGRIKIRKMVISNQDTSCQKLGQEGRKG